MPLAPIFRTAVLLLLLTALAACQSTGGTSGPASTEQQKTGESY